MDKKQYLFPASLVLAALIGFAFPGLLNEASREQAALKAFSWWLLFTLSAACLICGAMAVRSRDSFMTALGMLLLGVGGVGIYWLFTGALLQTVTK